ncbi:MAG TPA: hypothetical protein VM074_10560 [Solimonas sp.]|nr:hypothetical protein [Solimonas sp.]
MMNRTCGTALLACSLSLGVCAAQAADPASATLSPDSRTVEVTGGPFFIPNVTSQTEFIDLQGAPVCVPGTPICDGFDLKLDLPADYYTAHPSDVVTFTMSWDAPTGQEDYDFFLMTPDGTVIAQGEGTTNPEKMQICAGEGVQDYQVQIIPWNALGATYKLDVELKDAPKVRCKDPSPAKSGSAGAPAFGGALGLGLLLPLLLLGGIRSRR